jgi:hypothetical protein
MGGNVEERTSDLGIICEGRGGGPFLAGPPKFSQSALLSGISVYILYTYVYIINDIVTQCASN